MSILPSFYTSQMSQETDSGTSQTIPKEYGMNFSTEQLTGQIVEGKEAIKVWIWCCLQTQRFRYPIYSWDYGADMEQYIGRAVSREFLQTDCEDEIRSAMLVNPYISDITDFNVERKNDQIHISFRTATDFETEFNTQTHLATYRHNQLSSYMQSALMTQKL